MMQKPLRAIVSSYITRKVQVGQARHKAKTQRKRPNVYIMYRCIENGNIYG